MDNKNVENVSFAAAIVLTFAVLIGGAAGICAIEGAKNKAVRIEAAKACREAAPTEIDDCLRVAKR